MVNDVHYEMTLHCISKYLPWNQSKQLSSYPGGKKDKTGHDKAPALRDPFIWSISFLTHCSL